MTERVEINGEMFETFISEEQIRARIKELAARINADYAGKTILFIGVLNGSFIFLADLIREITVDCEMDFVKLSSYGSAKISSGQVKLLKKLDSDIAGRDVLVVEDIVDSGLSIALIKKIIAQEKPKSLKFISLLFKKDLPIIDFSIDYVGFEIPPDFVIGYGLDYAQKVRNLKSIYKIIRH
jgi:hypoxanthine phosphoribosyltransferase